MYLLPDLNNFFQPIQNSRNTGRTRLISKSRIRNLTLESCFVLGFFLLKKDVLMWMQELLSLCTHTTHTVTVWQREMNTAFISRACVRVCKCASAFVRRVPVWWLYASLSSMFVRPLLYKSVLCGSACARTRVECWFGRVCVWCSYDSFLPASSGCLRVWLVWRKPDSLNHAEEPETDVN